MPCTNHRMEEGAITWLVSAEASRGLRNSTSRWSRRNLLTTSQRRRTAHVAVGIATLLTLTACATGSSSAPSSTLPFAETYAVILADAKAGGASDEQMAEIETYIDGRSIPFSVVKGALERTFSCLDAAGLEYEDLTQETYPGFFKYDYLVRPKVGIADEATALTSNACQDREVSFIGSLYENQPSIVAARDQEFQLKRPELIECLRAHGEIVDDDATRDEISKLGVKIFADTDDPSCLAPQ
jgi:hypothetical protein